MAAATDPRLAVCRAVAEALPFADRSVRLAYFHLSIHHTDWRRALAEAVRVVDDAGVVEVITLGPVHHRQSFLARWMPRVAAIDIERFPAPTEVADELARLGLLVATSTEIQHKTRPALDWIAAVQARFVSTLQLLADAEVDDGLARMRAATGDLDGAVEYDMVWERITAQRRAPAQRP